MSEKMNENIDNNRNNLIELLPNEILEQILSNRCISYRDLCRMSCVSKRFNHLIRNSSEIWKSKFINNWFKLFNNKCLNISNDLQYLSNYWQKLVLERHNIGSDVRQEVFKLSQLYYFEDELSDFAFQPFIEFNKSNDRQLFDVKLFQINELENILNDGLSHKNLTLKYYALKVLRFLRHQSLKEQWIKYLEHNQKSNDLMSGALLISQWFESNQTLNEEHYKKQIQLMAELTINRIGLKYPKNSIIKENLGQCLTDLEANNLSDSKWSSDNCKQILLSLNEVLFNELRFAGNHENYYESCNSFIDKVIDNRLGIPITLCILYQSIAAKLGVKTFGVNFPHHFIIKWKHFE
jgi:F-box protein 21